MVWRSVVVDLALLLVLEPGTMMLAWDFHCLDSRWLSSLRDIAIVLF